MSLISDRQKLEPGSVIRLIEVDGTAFDADVLRFHYHQTLAVPDGDEDIPMPSIYWQGEEYKPWPYQVEGIEANSDGSQAAPTLTVSNIGGAITAVCLAYQNMVQAKVTIHETTSKYLDAANFTDGNSNADPEQESISVWYIVRLTSEDKTAVAFEMASPAAVLNKQIGRQLTPYCYWCHRGWYRGDGCGYTGTAYFTADDEATDDPEQDECSGTLTGCTLRFGEDNELPFGGEIAVRMIDT